MPSPIARAVVLALALLAARPAHAGVAVVDLSAPAPVLQAAVDAAAPGDILLLKPGSVEVASTITIEGKGLVLIADGGLARIGRLVVRDVPAGSQVTLRGLTLGTTFATGGPGGQGVLDVRDCGGSVWVEACIATAPPQFPGGFGSSYPGMSGAFVQDCAAVALLRSRFYGGRGAPESPSCTIPGYAPASGGGAGVHVSGSTLVIHGSELRGGTGGPDVFGQCQPEFGGASGGPGLRAQSASVHVAGTVLRGADMTSGSAEPGAGLLVLDASSSVSLRGATVLAGLGPPVVPDTDAPAGTVTTLAAPPRSLAVTSPVREGQPAQLVIDGQIGDLTAIFVGFTGAALVTPGKQGVWALNAPFFGPQLVAANPMGHWVIPFTAGNLTPASLQGQSFLLQLLVHDGSQVLFEGNTSYTLIDSTIP